MGKNFDIEKLKGSENYHTWCFAVKNLLSYKGWDKCITDPVTDTDEANLKNCKATLALSVETSIYVHIQNCSTALEIWTALQKLYEDRGLTRKISLLRNLISTKLEECDNMQEYVDRIISCSHKLTGVGFAITDEWLGAILLAGLTENFRPLIMGIEASGAGISGDTIVSKLIDAQTAEKGKGEAFFGHAKKKFNKKNNKFNAGKKCYVCGSKEHLSNACDKKKTKTEHAKNAFCALMCESKPNEWYIDSGASSHMTPHADILTEKRALSSANKIISANNAKMSVQSTGKTVLKLQDASEIEVRNVLHVPELAANLLSVSSIVNSGNSVLFNSGGCFIRNADNALIAQCEQKNGMYKFHAIQEACMAVKQNTDAYTWHRRLGHMNLQSMKKMRDGAVIGINYVEDNNQIKACEVCAKGKQARLPFKTSESRSSSVLELVHSDLVGPMETQSIGHARYILTLIDDYSKKVFVYFLKAKSDALAVLIEFKMLVENQTGRKIKVFRTDNGTEYCSNEFTKFCKANGIQHQLTNAYTPQQNGVAERMNRSLVEKAKCMLFDADLPKSYWAEATNMAAYIINRSVCNSHDKTPDEIFYGKKVNVADLRIFGSPIMVHVPKEKRKKWDHKSNKLIFVGYDGDTKGYRCIDKATRKLTISRDVIFHENTTPTKRFAIEDDEDNATNVSEGSVQVKEDDATNAPDCDQVRDDDDKEQAAEKPTIELNSETDESTEFMSGTSNDESITEVAEKDDPDYEPDETIKEVGHPNVTTRSKGRNFLNPFSFTNYFAFITEPTTVNEALNAKDSEKWKEAMGEEMHSHEENNTWSLTELPTDRKAIKAKWVYKSKRDQSGAIIRYKARLVAKGCAQKYGIDYDETYSPVVRHTSIRFLFALAVKKELRVHQMDAVTAFLQGELTESIYMEQPESYSDGTKRVCKLNKAIYGLKQAGRQWNLKLDAALLDFGLGKSKLDPCVYYAGKMELIVAIYVDDFLIFYKTERTLNEIKKFLSSTFKMKDIGPAKSCLGININQGDDYIELDQTSYINDILDHYGMKDCKPMGTPSDTNQKLSVQTFSPENSLVGQVPYQEAVGSLLYLTQATRPDIAFAVNDVSRFNNNHSDIHWKAIKRIFRYLSGTKHYKLKYTRKGLTDLHIYCDADWASDIDKRRSCTGFVAKLSNAAISWQSKRQSTTALSSTEAEYMALSSAVCEVIWIRQLAMEIDQATEKPTLVLCDNESAIKLGQSEAYRPRTKHIDIRFHHLREKVSEKAIELKHISTDLMAADSLTKAVSKQKHELCSRKMGLQ